MLKEVFKQRQIVAFFYGKTMFFLPVFEHAYSDVTFRCLRNESRI